MTVARVAAVVLGAVFLLSGALKVGRPSWPAQAAAFGVPRGMAPVLPWVELAVGSLLIVGVAPPWPALAALVLLVAFTAAVAVRLVQGRRVPCGCFGPASARPVGVATLVRNGVLLVLAVLAAG